MTSLKQSIKKVLIQKQHTKYQRECAARNLTYDEWIRGQERELEIAYSISNDETKSLTNDFQKEDFGSLKNKNEGNKSEKDGFCHFLTLCDRKDEKKKEMTILSVALGQFSVYKKQILENSKADVILISVYSGEISEIAYGLIAREFAENVNIILIYGDEDIQEGNIREKPWFKPDWSPDRFLSCFYFGGLVALRTDALRKAWREWEEEKQPGKQQPEQNQPEKLQPEQQQGVQSLEELYRMIYLLLGRNEGFQKREKSPVKHIRQVLFHSKENGYLQIKDCRLFGEPAMGESAALQSLTPVFAKNEEPAPSPMVSVIIPSKDNPDILFRCIDTFVERTRTGHTFEILVVDNGSGEANRKRIAGRLEKIPGASYLYQPMEFNFSVMCNMGAQKARGELLLFLNDDMEILQPNWLELMIEKARLPYAGAVGAKLLYPGSTTIQHAGITNLRVGPAHKLQFTDDREEHYYGMNRGVHDMMGVTGACLMVKKEVFRQAGGFAAELAVAFNDVDLCYTIYELGYYNMVRNDVVLYHHESLSRGKDGECTEKQLRLQREKDVLYQRHQELYGKDPFYHPYLTTDMLESEYTPAYHYQVDLKMPWSPVRRCDREAAGALEDACLVVGMEAAMDIYKWKYGVPIQKGRKKPDQEDMGYYFQGYSFIIGADNACYEKRLLLKNQGDGSVWSLPLENRYRPDIRNNLRDQLNVDLTGFAAKLSAGSIPDGVYQFGMLARDRCSRQRLINWSNWVLEVNTNEK